MPAQRIIVDYKGDADGPLLIVFGGMHGNEPAGVKAIELTGKMLDVEPITNPRFSFCGRFVGLIGNQLAYQKQKRYINADLNRCWTLENVEKAKTYSHHKLTEELQEIKEILDLVDNLIKEEQPQKVVILDLHTTSSFGGIFTIVTNDQDSLKIGKELHAPVITGLIDGIKGTTLHYFTSENFGVQMTPVTFESGQHNEQLSINRAIAAIINCMRTLDCVSPSDVANQHDNILKEYSKHLPKVSRLISTHHIKTGDDFIMKPGYKNFQKIEKGEHVADDINGPILAPYESLILMPLYQKQGEDGFFLIKEIVE